ncbi:PHP domain-containing protein [Spirochaeta isovalerica]|uniref:Polymerase/histidinol phosphatase N-terminal domain-containing protein n=1 Tax=Spirochaeta isovalerica TaxID=150 RepID=A0A841RCH2_9SPIO|nr:PHP domain-containing protein [Spirochaeta isovalerica]MBB6481091.1 hypothetical protein [Spirochaeta isovalerica]
MILKCDLHIHSCLSPCGSLEMSPSEIVKTALEKGLDVIAVADHNTALNSPAIEKLCRGTALTPLFAIEATSSEEFHSLCLFPTAERAVSFGQMLYENLVSLPNNPEKFGDQVYVDENDNILGELEKYLTGGAVSFSSDRLLELVHREGGLFIPAHIDRAAFSLTSQLGFIPPDPYDALEITNWPPPEGVGNLPLICDSDAHYPEDMGKRFFYLESPDKTAEAILLAIKQGRTRLSIAK